jgi:hypothetical protein
VPGLRFVVSAHSLPERLFPRELVRAEIFVIGSSSQKCLATASEG